MQPLHDGAHSPGDRYPLNVCRGKGTVRVLAVAPYTFTFSAPVKGRWLGRPLLNVFAKEFAYIPPVSAENELPRASLDPSVTIPAYIEELRTGLLLLRGREAECRAAGEAYIKELGSLSTSFISLKEEHNKTAARSEEKEEASLSLSSLLLLPDDAGSPLHTEETDDVMKYFLSAMSPRLLLRQRDVIIHHVLRREAPIACNDPLHVLRYDHVARGSPPRRLLVVRKPHGIPVHPSGCYRKNSVTSILEDVFGGIDAHRYCVVPLNKENMEEEREKEKGGKGREKNSSKKDTTKKCLQPVDGVEYMAICHKKYGFELIRVWVGDGYVTQAAWKELESFLTSSSSSQQEQKHSRCCLKTFVVHRLDAATSGVLLFGLDSPSARITTELLSRKSNTDETVEETPDVGCAKQYIARVHGRFDVAKLAEGQHHCSYDDSLPTASYSPFVFPSVLPLLTANSAEDCGKNPHWLRVDRPIGCLSYHESLYWCPDAVLTQSWMKEQKEKNEKEKKEKDQQQQQQREDMSPRNTSAAGRKRAPYTDTAMLEAKHERMRRLTTGGRGGGSTAVDGTKKKSSDETAVDHKTERLKESMKRAITLIRFVAYDAACDESVVECFLLSGRTHQVRVHLASLGHPIRGDKKYIHMAASVLSGSASTSSCSVCSPLNEATMKREEEEEGMREDEGYLMSHGIFLHAWRYTLFYSKDEAPEIFEAPPPACMLTGVVNDNDNNNNNEEEEKAREEKN